MTMRWDKYDVPENLLYHKEHTWLRVAGNEAFIGVTDFAQQLAGEMNTIEVVEVGHTLKRDARMGSIETGKWVGKLYAPVDGEVVELNEEVVNDARTVNRQPYGMGWILKMRMQDPSQTSALLTPAAYVEAMKKKKAELKM